VTRQSKADARREVQRAHVERILRMYRGKLDVAHAAGDVVQVVALTLRCADHVRPTIPMGGGLITGTEADDLAALVVAELTERGWLANGHPIPPRGMAGRFIRRPVDLTPLPFEVPS